jgi:hypothetical protein
VVCVCEAINGMIVTKQIMLDQEIETLSSSRYLSLLLSSAPRQASPTFSNHTDGRVVTFGIRFKSILDGARVWGSQFARSRVLKSRRAV